LDQTAFIELLKSGNRKAFEQLVRDQKDKVINICFRFLLNQQDAEDLAQAVFIEVFQSISNFKGASKISTWIHAIAVSKCLDELKSRKRKKRFVEAGKKILPDNVADWLDAKIRPDKDLEEKEGLSQLMDALNTLPVNQRVAITLSKVEGYSHLQIAEFMQISLSSVDSLVFRAKQNLKAKFLQTRKNN
jgi:RNA polymerase sigma-70 factor (ECF subfamily)